MGLTGKTGLYQDSIPDLFELTVDRYERLFKLYTVNKNGKEFYFYNILKKLELPDNIHSDMVDFYICKTREPFTIVSYNIYDTIHLWWLIYLLNKDVIGNKMFCEPSIQLKYIIPGKLDLVFSEITNLTIFDGRHF